MFVSPATPHQVLEFVHRMSGETISLATAAELVVANATRAEPLDSVQLAKEYLLANTAEKVA